MQVVQHFNVRRLEMEHATETYQSLDDTAIYEESIDRLDSFADEEETAATIRKDFRETWLWEEIDGYANKSIVLL